MLFGNDRNDIRQHFFNVWQKFNNKQPLEPMEEIIASIIKLHPEYHSLLKDTQSLDKDYTPEMEQTNPFLHMGMHIALHEQLTTNRPAGIKQAYEKLQTKTNDIHETEHRMMECLGEAMWQAQRNNTMPDEAAYLDCLKKLAGKN